MDLTDEQWALIEPLIPVKHRSDGRGRPPKPARVLLDGILWILRTGARYQAYRDFLQEELSAFGITEKDFADRTVFASRDGQIESPFLVRINYDIPALTTEELAKYNQAAPNPSDLSTRPSNCRPSCAKTRPAANKSPNCSRTMTP